MSERSLAHVETVIDVAPVPNSDNLDVCTVLGWRCVTKRGELKAGDKILYIEVDSIVPDIKFFDFMKQRKFRVKTIKLRQQISQGLVIPYSEIMNIKEQIEGGKFLGEMPIHADGFDMTKYLGITKYLSPSEREENLEHMDKKNHNFFIKFMTRFSWFRKMFKKKSKSFPAFIRVTDEIRCQNFPEVLNDRSEDWYISEKVDGSSLTAAYVKKTFGGEFYICSRNVRKFEFDSSVWSKIARHYNIKANLKKLNKTYGNLAVQGEVVGQRIQGNKYKLPELDLYIFNVYNIDERKMYPLDEAQKIVSLMGLKFIPVLECFVKLPETVDECLAKADGMSVINEDTIREGLVFRKIDMSRSFKAVSNKFLLSNEE